MAQRRALDADSSARDRLDAIATELENLGICTPACLATLEDFRHRFPGDPRVLELLRTAYLRLQDWEALIRLEEALPGVRSTADRIQLAAVYRQAGRFGEAASQLEALLGENPASVDLTRNLAVVWFELGGYERVLELLDQIDGRLSGAQAAEAETLRGLVHFYRQDLAVAETHLARALELDADSVTALSGMARVLAARDRPERAQEYLRRAGELQQANLARTRRALRLSARSRIASEACVARLWDECERVIRDMLSEANRSEQIGIYRYLGGMLDQAGRPEAAREAVGRAEELARQTNDR